MTLLERREFIQQHIERIKATLMNTSNIMPETWEGLELKQYIADKFSIPNSWWNGRLKRKKSYNNDVMVENL